MKKWCKYFVNLNYDVYIVSFEQADIRDVTVIYVNSGAGAEDSDSNKIKYLFKASEVKKIIKKIDPQIVSVHYATSYGTVAALSGIKGYYLSVWGSDIYDFPKKSFVHKLMLRYSLSKAAYLMSTSVAMATEGKKYTNKEFIITPFGVDMDLFNPSKRNREDNSDFIIGTVKGLYYKYGIDYLLKAVRIIRDEHRDIPLKVRIAGDGKDRGEFIRLAEELQISDCINWLGFISQNEAAKEWANMDVAVIPSVLESESFGVAAVEAEACGTPVVISNIPGLMEATKPDISSIVVPRMDERALADAIVSLFENPEMRKQLGKNGRDFVKERYEINNCFQKIENTFIRK